MKLRKRSIDRVVHDFREIDLGDPRRGRRARRVVAKLARRPSVPLPAALGNDAAVQGAYRLINNVAVTFAALMGSHADATRRRAEEAQAVLVLHDTTDCSFPHVDPQELGYLNTGKAGFRLHLSLVVDANDLRQPLGTIYAETLHRTKKSKRSGKRKASGSDTANRNDREFQRWSRGIEASAEALANCRKVIHVGDRESDSFELMTMALSESLHFVFRVRVDRRGRQPDTEADTWSTIKQVAASCEGTAEREVPLSARKAKSAPGMNRAHPPRKMRIAKLRFSATRVEIPRPQYLHDPIPCTLTLNLVRVIEIDPPPGEKPVEWLLYTSEPIDTAKQVETVVDTYRARWIIEEFNAALKTGCAYEARQFETRNALVTMLALSLPVACEILRLRSYARCKPTASASDLLSPLQLRILHKLGPYKLSANPNAQEAMLAVAALGGHLKRNGPPGWKILQRGMALLLAYQAGWAAARGELSEGNL